MKFTGVIDAVLDRSVVLGYTKIGSGLRSLWWPADPGAGALATKRVLVTGATSGIGEAMAKSFAELGATVYLLGRNAEKVKHSAGRIRGEVPGAVVFEETCDVSDLDAVRAWTDDFNGRVDALHGLVHNAGAMPKERIETAQHHETQFACHVLGPQLMTERLLPLLRMADGAQVVFVSSGGMYAAPLEVDDLESAAGKYDGVRVYARTKRMQVVLAGAWAERLADERLREDHEADERLREDHESATDVRVASMHPGWAATPGTAESLPTFQKLTGPLLRDATDGADTAVWLVATRPPSRPPHFWHDRAQRPTTFGWQRAQDPRAVAKFLDEVSELTETSRNWVALPA
ncbi:MAG: dehydrogenase/reductase family er 12 [Mycobacterium sp.]|nr:dehydrogenase/reductase family er 12 [Mycobacterium sp.]